MGFDSVRVGAPASPLSPLRSALGRALGAVAAVVLLNAVPMHAQEQTGQLRGVVRDQQGAPIPGASVSVRNVSVGAAIDTVADGQGTFLFVALAPGLYDVSAAFEGFQPVRIDRVEVLLGQGKRLDVVLPVAGVVESVHVSAPPPLVDVTQDARAASLRQAQLAFLPRGVDYTSVVRLVPGAATEPKLGGLSIDGASAAENRFIIDGVDTTSPLTGLSTPTRIGPDVLAVLSVDHVDELQVKSSGEAAEYGGATGGVINVLTKSGTNAWHGNVGAYLGGDVLDAGARPTLRLDLTRPNIAEYVTYPEDDYSSVQPSASLGGPIRRDRAWFFVGYEPVVKHTERTVTFTLDGSSATVDQAIVQHLLTASQTSQWGASLRTRASVNGSPGSVDGNLPAKAGTESPVSNFDMIERVPSWSASGTADWLPSSGLQVSGRVGYSYADSRTENVRGTPFFEFPVTNIGLLDVPVALQRVTGFQTDAGNEEHLADRPTRVTGQVDATWRVQAWGTHAFKAGWQGAWTRHVVNRSNKANLVALYWDRDLDGQRGRYGYYTVVSNPFFPKRGTILLGRASGDEQGLFLQDSWTIGRRLTVNAGIRTARETVPSYSRDGSSPPAITLGFGDKLAPRLGAAYDLRGDGRWKIFGSWGVFHDSFKYVAATGFGAYFANMYRYTLDTYQWPTLLSDAACPPACPGTFISETAIATSTDVPVDPDLQPMRSQEAVAGVEHQLRSTLVLSARYVHKQLDRAVEDIGALDADLDEVYTIGNPGLGVAQYAFEGVRLPKAVRDYDALELVARRTLSNRWSLDVSYVWSRLSGNYSGLSHSDENGRVDPNIGRVFDSGFMMFDEHARPVLGRLATDRPHQAKALFVYQGPRGLSAGLSQYVASGVPVSRVVRVVPGSNYPMLYRGRMSDGRTPALSQADLQVQQELHLSRDTHLSIGLIVSNLFNQDAVLSKFSDELQQGEALSLSAEEFYAGRVDMGRLKAEQGVSTDARFLLPDAFQNPRSARVFVKWSF